MNAEPGRAPELARPLQVDALVIGAGPTGLVAANLLALYGLEVLIVEQNDGPVTEPRAVILDDEFCRVLATLNAEQELREHSFGPVGVHYLSPLGFAILKVAGFTTPNGFANRTTIWQPKLEEVLARRFEERLPGRLRFRLRLAGFAETDTGIEADVRDADGRTLPVRARYLVAADGAKSTVREQLGIELMGFSAEDQPHVVVDVANDPDGDLPHTKFYCDPRRPCTCVPLPYGMRRFEFFLFPDEDPQAMLEPDSLAKLFEPYRNFSSVEVVRKAVYVFHARLAERMSTERVFLIGDAAHLMPPFGAQGMNSGARDANNLAWKIAAVAAGHCDKRVLESYERERRDHLARIIRYSVRMGRLSNITSRIGAALRDSLFAFLKLLPPVQTYFRSMRHMPKPDVGAGLVARHGSSEALTGRPMPRLKLAGAGDDKTTLDDVMGAGFALLSVDSDYDLSAAATRLRAIDPQATCVRIAEAGASAHTPADNFARQWCRENAGLILVIRPDRYVCIAADSSNIDVALSEFLASTATGS